MELLCRGGVGVCSSSFAPSRNAVQRHIGLATCRPAHDGPKQGTGAGMLCASRSRLVRLECRALGSGGGGPGGPRPGSSGGGASLMSGKVNTAYVAIVGVYVALLAFRSPYVYAALSVACILPQNSSVTSLNNLVLTFYESGLFQNFGEAVTCVRLATWLSIGFTLASFALFS